MDVRIHNIPNEPTMKNLQTKGGGEGAMKWKRTTYDCPTCGHALFIYTNKKGSVKRVIKAEKGVEGR